jgi:hypothetical protein
MMLEIEQAGLTFILHNYSGFLSRAYSINPVTCSLTHTLRHLCLTSPCLKEVTCRCPALKKVPGRRLICNRKIHNLVGLLICLKSTKIPWLFATINILNKWKPNLKVNTNCLNLNSDSGLLPHHAKWCYFNESVFWNQVVAFPPHQMQWLYRHDSVARTLLHHTEAGIKLHT